MAYFTVTLAREKAQRVLLTETARICVEADDEAGAREAAARLAEDRPDRVFLGDDEDVVILDSEDAGGPRVVGARPEEDPGAIEVFAAEASLG